MEWETREMESLWMEEVQIPRRKPAEGLYERDVVVIGAGMAGVLIAWRLQQAGLKVAILEADRIAGGQTGRTTAKITSQHGLIYSKMVEEIGWKKARLYAEANQKAIDEYENLVQKYHIECDFERVPAYIYSAKEAGKLLEEAQVAAELGIPAYYTDSTELPFQTAGAVCFERQACFHPLKFIRCLAEQLEIYEESAVTEVRKGLISTGRAKFLTDKVVFSCHYPFRIVPGFYFLRQHQERSYVIALEREAAPTGTGGIPRKNDKKVEIKGMYLSAEGEGLSFRSTENHLLLGGNSHRTGENRQGGAYGSLKAAACKYFPGSRVVAQWSAQDCMPHDGVPFIGRFSVWRKNWYVATGFGKWGMTSSMVAAMLLTDMIQGKINPWEKVFTPQRLRIQAGARNFWLDMAESISGLTKGLFVPWEGETCARCTHMGCKLTRNPDDHSWDCPCHGSRYDEEGHLLDDPAQRDMYR